MTIPAEIHHGELPLILSDIEAEGTTGELDTLTITVLASFPGWREDLTMAGFVKGQKVAGYHAIFVENFQRGSRSDLSCEVSVSCLGLLEPGEKRKRVLGVAGQQLAIGPFEKIILAWTQEEQGEEANGSPVELVKRRVPKVDASGDVIYEIIATPSGTAERWNVRQPVVTVTDTYFVTSFPSMAQAGSAMTPPHPPAVPGSPWGGYDKPIRANHPHGWVLDDRQVEELFPASSSGGLWAVTDTYGHYLAHVPD